MEAKAAGWGKVVVMMSPKPFPKDTRSFYHFFYLDVSVKVVSGALYLGEGGREFPSILLSEGTSLKGPSLATQATPAFNTGVVIHNLHSYLTELSPEEGLIPFLSTWARGHPAPHTWQCLETLWEVSQLGR